MEHGIGGDCLETHCRFEEAHLLQRDQERGLRFGAGGKPRCWETAVPDVSKVEDGTNLLQREGGKNKERGKEDRQLHGEAHAQAGGATGTKGG